MDMSPCLCVFIGPPLRRCIGRRGGGEEIWRELEGRWLEICADSKRAERKGEDAAEWAVFFLSVMEC